MTASRKDLGTWIDVPVEPRVAFDAFVDDLVSGLERRGLRIRPGPDGVILRSGKPIARVVEWRPGSRIRFEWAPGERRADEAARVVVEFEPRAHGTRITLGCEGWHRGFEGLESDLAGWFAREIAAPFLGAADPEALGDWITDRRARRPSGEAARVTYRDPVYHRPNFKLLLHVLDLRADDYLVEVGCGGGAFLQEALRSGCRAAAIDHSLDMVRVAREVNRDAWAAGRMEAVKADAERIPYAGSSFTAAVTTGVFGFIEDPPAMLAEVHRVLRPSGRFALFTGTRELVGTPAAPEPIASRLHFYEDQELRGMAQTAGFVDVRVERPDLEAYAREADLPDDVVAIFRGGGGGAQLLTAHRP